MSVSPVKWNKTTTEGCTTLSQFRVRWIKCGKSKALRHSFSISAPTGILRKRLSELGTPDRRMIEVSDIEKRVMRLDPHKLHPALPAWRGNQPYSNIGGEPPLLYADVRLKF